MSTPRETNYSKGDSIRPRSEKVSITEAGLRYLTWQEKDPERKGKLQKQLDSLKEK